MAENELSWIRNESPFFFFLIENFLPNLGKKLKFVYFNNFKHKIIL